jgi:hypothetical protein
MSSRVLGTLGGALIALALVCVPSAAGASQIDNDSGENHTKVWFDCGIACGNYFDIPPGESRSRPGKAGYVQSQRADASSGVYCDISGKDQRAHVSAHGEIGYKFSETDHGSDDPTFKVTWTATQDNGEHDQWTFDMWYTSANTCWGLAP